MRRHHEVPEVCSDAVLVFRCSGPVQLAWAMSRRSSATLTTRWSSVLSASCCSTHSLISAVTLTPRSAARPGRCSEWRLVAGW